MVLVLGTLSVTQEEGELGRDNVVSTSFGSVVCGIMGNYSTSVVISQII